ncbi:hypothetical protein BVRB_4g091330 [Beta vulgaris subsp. vulgaris]|nr:hypothetical protein BVRB_4g091330 [Beta vulgaris subsp. vulgaris]
MARISTNFFIITVMLAVFLALSAPSFAQKVNTACRAAGEFCGGFAGFVCCKGFTCILEGDFPDAGGICKPKY